MSYRYQALYTLESLGGDGYDLGQSKVQMIYQLYQSKIQVRHMVVLSLVIALGYTGGSNINFGGNVYVGNNTGYFHDGGGSTFYRICWTKLHDWF